MDQGTYRVPCIYETFTALKSRLTAVLRCHVFRISKVKLVSLSIASKLVAELRAHSLKVSSTCCYIDVPGSGRTPRAQSAERGPSGEEYVVRRPLAARTAGRACPIVDGPPRFSSTVPSCLPFFSKDD